VVKIAGEQLVINPEITAVDSIDAFVAPYRNRIDEVLDSTLAYAPKVISKQDGTLNSSAGNLMADIVMAQAAPIFKSRTGKDLDFVLLNHGGIRSIISQGNVSARDIYEVMPFENSIVVAELPASAVRKLVTFLVRSGQPHPISGIQIVLDSTDSLSSVNIQGKPFDENRTYFVATSNYLINGGDKMDFFNDRLGITDTDYLIRNAMIDYLNKVDTLAPVVDGRFMRLK
jgi:2',3'-cyclic-nucleotide 2'-phosphodiesterase (5'-nucleotidase family)